MNTRTKKWTMNMLLLAAMLLILSSTAQALGVGPSRLQVSYAPGQEIEGELLIINDQQEDFRAAIYAQGELSSFVELDEQLVEVKASEPVKRIKYKLKFPSYTPKPGPHKVEIVIRQFPSGGEAEEGTVISASMAVISQIIIKVSYPGKYAEGKLFINGMQTKDSPGKFTVMLYNFGTEEIDSAHARIEILGPLLGKIAEFNTNTVSVKSKEEAKLEAQWSPSVNQGTFKAVVTVYYDDKQMKLEQAFDIGSFVVDISDVNVEKFTLGDVAKFDIYLKNNWNTKIEDVYVEMVVEDSTGKQMTEFKTAAQDMPVQETIKFESYWYTEGVMPGLYKVKLRVHYSGKITEKEYDFEVNTNSIKRLGAAGQAVATQEEQGEVKTQGLLIILILVVIVLLLIMNFVWFYFIVKQIRGKGGGK